MSGTGKLRMKAAGDHRMIYIVYILKSHTRGRRLILKTDMIARRKGNMEG